MILHPDQSISSLTVGERQQLEMCACSALGVQVFILDEPTTGISEPQKVRLFQTLQQLADEGLAVIFVSHKLDEVGELCSEATVLRKGRVVGAVASPFSTDELVQLDVWTISRRREITSKLRPARSCLSWTTLRVHTYRLQLEGMSSAASAKVRCLGWPASRAADSS